MKNNLSLLGLFIMCFSFCMAENNCSCCRKSPAQQLISRLRALQERGYMFGHQDDPMYGLSWEWEYGRSDVREVCGDYPAVMGFDLGGIEMEDDKNLDSVPFTRIREEIIAHHDRGGIVTISWHPRNPLTGGTAWDVSDSTVVKNILLNNSDVNGKFKEWLSRVSVFLKTLKTDSGESIPVIFRPWHENTGSWFWWGEKLCTEDEFKGLWNMTQDYMRHEGFHNLVWSYSPGMAQNLTEDKFMERYPGNSRVDMVGIDGYQWGKEEDFVSELDANLDMITGFAKKNNKIPALTECGLKNLTDPTWFSRVLKPVTDKYPISYFLVWRNYKKEYFAPAPGHPCEKDFMKLYDAKNTLFLKDIQ